MKNSLVEKKEKKYFFRNLIDYVKLLKSDKEAKKLIEKFRKHPKFSADKSEFVKYATHLMCEKDSDLCVFFADGDNLMIANEIANRKAEEINFENARRLNLPDITLLKNKVTGEQIVDADIESVLQQIKNVNSKFGYNNALVGIQGDEIFIAIPHIKTDDIEQIYKEYSKAQSGLVTISVGYCNDMSKGAEEAFNKAEERAQITKNEKKKRNRQIVLENPEQILTEELKRMLLQLRIQVKDLSEEQKTTLKDNIIGGFKENLKVPIGIANEVKQNMDMPETKKSIIKRVESLENSFFAAYRCSVNQNQRENFILQQILTTTQVDGVEKLEYYMEERIKKSIPKDKEKAYKKFASKKSLVSIELSGIKDINEIYGHAKCDDMVYETVRKIKQALENAEISMDSPIIFRNISSYEFLISSKNSKDIPKISKAISSIQSEFKISVASSELGEGTDNNLLEVIMTDTEKISVDVLNYLIKSASLSNREKNMEQNITKKIQDKKSISRYIAVNLKRIYDAVGHELEANLINSSLNHLLGLEDTKELSDNKENSNTQKNKSEYEKAER